MSALSKGALHTALLETINEALVTQHSGAFHEDSDGELIIPSGVTPQSAYVKIDTSWLVDVALAALSASPAEQPAREAPIPPPSEGWNEEALARIISGAPFPSKRSFEKARAILAIAPSTGGEWRQEDRNHEFELECNGMWVAAANAESREDAFREINHYAAQYASEGPCEIFELKRLRRPLPTPPLSASPLPEGGEGSSSANGAAGVPSERTAGAAQRKSEGGGI